MHSSGKHAESIDKYTVSSSAVYRDRNPAHAGGVVFRKHWWGTARYLLVQAKDDPAQWVLPKGHVEEGEQHRETAVREVLEETGVWARIRWSNDEKAVALESTSYILTVNLKFAPWSAASSTVGAHWKCRKNIIYKKVRTSRCLKKKQTFVRK